jgi:hypothetical protein
MPSERGVSAVIGFVLVFAMVLLMTGLVYTAGTGELRELRDAQQTESVQRAFAAVDADVTDVVRDGAPLRRSTVRIRTGALTYGDPVEFNLTVENRSGHYGATTRPLLFRQNNRTELAYTAGLLARSGSGGGWAVVRDPPMRFDDWALLSYIVVRPVGDRRVEGARAITIETRIGTRYAPYRAAAPAGQSLNATLNVTGTPRAAAWGRYLEREAGATCAVSGENATCEFGADRIVVSGVRVDVRFM